MIFDLEANAKKPEQVTVVWCICLIDEDGTRLRFGPRRIREGVERLRAADKLIGHNIGCYDIPVLERIFGFKYDGQIIDTLILSRMINNGLSSQPDAHGRHSLAAWGSRLGFEKGDHKDFSRFSPEMLEYCMRDCEVTEKLVDHLRKQKPSKRAVELELQYDRLLRRVEAHGFGFDTEGAMKLKAKLGQRLERLQELLDGHFPPEEITTSRPSYYTFESRNGELFETEFPRCETKAELQKWRKEHGVKPKDVRIVEGPPITKTKRFNACSPKQVLKAMRGLGWEPTEKNESGSYSTSEIELYRSGLASGRLIAAYRAFSKIRSFTTQWLAHARDGRLYPSFVGNRATTGRSSSRSPNIQQIPTAKKRKSGLRVVRPYGHRCRQLFTSQPGYSLIGSDLCGIEVRLLAHRLAPHDDGDFARRVLRDGVDIHQENGDRLGIPRDTAKTVLYGSMYGIGAAVLAADLQIGLEDAKVVIQGFTCGLPGFDAMKKDLEIEWKRSKRITLIDGRRIQVGKFHQALNYAIQGDAAILMKRWALDVEHALANTSYRMLAVVHDEIQGECLPGDTEKVVETLTRTATAAGEKLGFRIQIEADAKEGHSWRDTH